MPIATFNKSPVDSSFPMGYTLNRCSFNSFDETNKPLDKILERLAKNKCQISILTKQLTLNLLPKVWYIF